MKNEIIGDVWKLETLSQEQASNEINWLYEQATEHRSTRARNILKSLYDDDWQTIRERMETEGSVWYVWYMDGVNELVERGSK
jgi:hypothetical protein